MTQLEIMSEVVVLAADITDIQKDRIKKLEKRVADLEAMLGEVVEAGIKSCISDQAIRSGPIHRSRVVLAGGEFTPLIKG